MADRVVLPAEGRNRAHAHLGTVLACVILAVLALVFAAAGCGGGEHNGHDAGDQRANVGERGFLQAMVPHHESAIEMADVAVERAKDPKITRLAAEIRDAQGPEIEQMRRIHQRLFGTALRPDDAGHEALGLSAEQAGMNHADAAQALDAADPFDRAFIDEMVPHHRGAIAMARAVLVKTGDAELRKLARTIIDTQRREITEMNALRTERYGGPVPRALQEAGDAGHRDGEH